METNEERGVERERVLEADPDRVWDALTDEELLSDWFAPGARLDPVEGGEVSFDCEDGERSGTVQTVEEQRELSFTWSRQGEGESVVTFLLEPLEVGTRLVVVERALSPAPTAVAAAALGTPALWARRLRSLDLVVGALVFA
jgi:uncharacterized protein YndB with AHSA1/START domain